MKEQRLTAGNIIDKAKGYKETTVIFLTILLSIILSISSPVFLTQDNIKTTLIGLSCDGIIGIGMTLALISGGFDLSVGAVMGLAAVVAASLYSTGMNIWLAALISIAACTLVGAVNGLLIGKVGINAFITTLGMMEIARGAIYVITNGSSLSTTGDSKSFDFLGNGSLIGIPMIVIIFIVFTVLGQLIIRHSAPTMNVFYVGSNEKAAKLSGINTSSVKMFVYIFSAILASLAGILSLSRFGVATSNMGDGSEMRVISAAVIGGASLSGGEGSVVGTVFGVILLNIINNALVLYNVSVNWQNLISGVILILAVSVDVISHKKRAAHE
jgi:ribose transport system permease protein